ncbi:MAG: hypothetical protein GSR82_04455, partial [Desulfurococcales archaeon]|nr:hypothetical protein [Desulfurococcales archaeon]
SALYLFASIIVSGYFASLGLIYVCGEIVLGDMFLEGWIIGGILAYSTYSSIMKDLAMERLRLAVHMLRNHILYAKLAIEKGNLEAERLLVKMEEADRSLIKKILREAMPHLQSKLTGSTVESIRKGLEPPSAVIYREILSSPLSKIEWDKWIGSRLVKSLLIVVFVMAGIGMLLVSLIVYSIVFYMITRDLFRHQQLESLVRESLGINSEHGNALGPIRLKQRIINVSLLVLSILSLGFLLPLYARFLEKRINEHLLNSYVESNYTLV